MEERVIIASTRHKFWKTFLILFLVMVLLWAVYAGIICNAIESKYKPVQPRIGLVKEMDPVEYLQMMRQWQIREHEWSEIERNLATISYVLQISGVCILLLFAVAVGGCKIVVTDKRIYGRRSFCRSINIPLYCFFGAAETKFMSRVTLTTKFGNGHFFYIKNATEICDTVNKLLTSENCSH